MAKARKLSYNYSSGKKGERRTVHVEIEMDVEVDVDEVTFDPEYLAEMSSDFDEAIKEKISEYETVTNLNIEIHEV